MAEARHGKCGKTFPNSARFGHCGGCHETFFGLVAFDRHRTTHGYCREVFEDVDGCRRDSRGFWHHGPKLTEEQKEKMWGAKA